MKKYLDKDIEKAKLLRKTNKYSFAQIQKITGIPATTIRNWCKDEFIGTRWDTLLLTNKRKREEILSSEIKILNKYKTVDNSTAKLLASLLYWCEGTKYPASNKLEFTNSDPVLQKVFIFLIRKGFNLKENKFRIHLQIHNTHNFDQIRKYWSNLLNIPENQFIKPTITVKKGGKHRQNYSGTCTLRYPDYKLKLKLIGLYEEFGKIMEKSHSGLV